MLLLFNILPLPCLSLCLLAGLACPLVVFSVKPERRLNPAIIITVVYNIIPDSNTGTPGTLLQVILIQYIKIPGLEQYILYAICSLIIFQRFLF